MSRPWDCRRWWEGRHQPSGLSHQPSGGVVRASSFLLRTAWGLESDRDEGDTYSFQPVPGDRALRGRQSPSRVIWDGPLVAAIARDLVVGARVRATVSVRIDAG